MTEPEQPEDAGALELSAGVTIAGWDAPVPSSADGEPPFRNSELTSLLRQEILEPVPPGESGCYFPLTDAAEDAEKRRVARRRPPGWADEDQALDQDAVQPETLPPAIMEQIEESRRHPERDVPYRRRRRPAR